MKNYINKSLYDDIKAGTNIISGAEYQQILYAVSQVASDLVVKTLGPSGKTTLLDDGSFTYPTKDGYNVLNRLRFNDAVCNSLFMTLKQISFNIVTKVGDGTTTALVGANEFLKLMLDYQDTHSGRQADLINQLEQAKNKIISELLSGNEVNMIDTEGDFADIYKIALVSSNTNAEIANIIRTIYQQTHNPNIYVTLDGSNALSYEIQNGYKFDCNVINHKAYVNEDNGICKKTDESYVAIFDHNVTYNEHGKILQWLSNYASHHGREFIVIAPYFDDVISTVIGTTINTFLQKGQIPNIMMVQVPLSMEIHKQYLSDIVLLTNAQVFDYGKVKVCNILDRNQRSGPDDQIKDPLLELDQYNFTSTDELFTTCLGMTSNITFSEKYGVLQDYTRIANPVMLKNTLDEAKATYTAAKIKANKSTSVLNKDYMDAYQRYTKLVGQMGVIRVGGVSELEKHCLKDSIDDAVLACRSAYDSGFVKGLNISLLRTIAAIIRNNEPKRSGIDTEIFEMFYKTFENVSLSVLRNKYQDRPKRNIRFIDAPAMDPDIDYGLNKTADSWNHVIANNKDILDFCVRENYGYNLITDQIENAWNYSVINSVSTDIEILKAIVSILSIILTSDQFLSVNRGYDRQISKQQAIETISSEKSEIAKAVTTALLSISEKTLTESPIFKMLVPEKKSFFDKLFGDKPGKRRRKKLNTTIPECMPDPDFNPGE